jgi:hypothetical protein
LRTRSPIYALFSAFVVLSAACTVSSTSKPSFEAAPDPDGRQPTGSGSGDSPDLGTGRAPGDGSANDAGTDATESTPGEILGTLSGSCGVVKTLLTTASPSFEKNDLVFTKGEKYDRDSLSPGGQRMFDTPNAGGTSGESEVMSFEVLRACEGATLLKTETEIDYVTDDAGAQTITDILVEIGGKKVGVSVTRAYKPSNISFPDSDVKALLEKKLEGVIRSSQRVAAEDRWVKQILHVFAANKAEADAVARVLPTIDAAIRSNTIVLLTETTGGGFVYCNPDPPLGSECP